MRRLSFIVVVLLAACSSAEKPTLDPKKLTAEASDQPTLATVKSDELMPFTYLRGEADNKILQEKSFSVLNLNTCLMPGDLARIFGGMRPWEKRIDPLAEKLRLIDADVICLQEVFVEEAAHTLYTKLKDHYAHFYISIGERILGFSLNSLGLTSGLFIASKFPIESPSFQSFPELDFRPAYGFFDFAIYSEGKIFAHIYNAHLHPLDFQDIRTTQLAQILERMQSDCQKMGQTAVPHLLCGDLNIPWGSDEPSENLIQDHFYDAYNQGRTEITADDMTCTDYFSSCYQSTKDQISSRQDGQILDYALLLKQHPPIDLHMETKRISMYTLQDPEHALTDHHGLLSVLSL